MNLAVLHPTSSPDLAGPRMSYAPEPPLHKVEASLRRQIDLRTRELTRVEPAVAADLLGPLTELALRAGHRIRGRCVWLGWRIAGGSPDDDAPSWTLGAAVELLQLCALIHDDLMDQSDERRGGPTLHRHYSHEHQNNRWHGDAGQHGMSAALLAGDLALVWAEDVYREARLAFPKFGASVDTVWRGIRRDLVLGQHRDLLGQVAPSRFGGDPLRTAELKTASYTFAGPLELGAAAAGAPTSLRGLLAEVGTELGIAFQLLDDLDNVFAGSSKAGKTCGDDLRQGKRTQLVLEALRRCDGSARTHDREALLRVLGNMSAGEAEVQAAVAVLERSGARGAVEDLAAALLRRARARLASLRLPADVRWELQLLTAGLGEATPQEGETR